MRRDDTAALGFSLTLLNGRGVLALERPPAGGARGGLVRIDRLEMEVPELRFPFDLSGGVERFRNRRCRLRALALSFGAEEARALLAQASLGEYGLSDVEIGLEQGLLRVAGRAAVGGRTALFSFRGSFRRGLLGEVRLSFFDVRLYGFLPVPAALVPSALFAALGAASVARSPTIPPARAAVPSWIGEPEPLVRAVGPCDLELDALSLALFPAFAAAGWRLPERFELEAKPVFVQGERFVLELLPQGASSEAPAPLTTLEMQAASAEAWAHEEGGQRFAEAEAALLAGELPTALAAYRRAALLAPADPFVATRLLQLLCASPDSLALAEELASATLARTPDFVPALIAKGTAAGELGRPAEAALAFEQVASLSRDGASSLDEAAALVAAAGHWQRAGDPARATAVLEAAVAARPSYRIAACALAQRLRAEGRWSELLGLLRQRAVDEQDAGARARLYADAGLVFLEQLGDVPRARDRFDQAIRTAPGEPLAWEGLGRLELNDGTPTARGTLERALGLYRSADDRSGQARALSLLAELDGASGDRDGARARLRQAADLDPESWQPLAQAALLAHAAAEPAAAIALLEEALARATETEHRVLLLRRLAAAQLEGPGDRVAARLRLEEALRASPADLGALDDLCALLDRQGDEEEADHFLRRALAAPVDVEAQRAIHGRFAERARRRDDPAALQEALAALAALGGVEGARAALELADRAAAAPDAAAVGRAADALDRLLVEEGEPLPRAELGLALCRLREAQGDEEGALAALKLCLEADAAGATAIAAWERFVALARRRGDDDAAGQALVAWAHDARTGEPDAARAAHLVAAARLLVEHPEARAEALALLDRAASLRPHDDATSDALLELAERLAAWGVLAGALRERLAREGEAADLGRLRRLASVLAGPLRRDAEAAEIARRVLDRAPGDVEARLILARHLWLAARNEESAQEYEALLRALPAQPEADPLRAEAHLRLAQWARVADRAPEAERHLEQALQIEATAVAPVDVLVEVLEGFGRIEELLALLRARAAAASDQPARRDALQALAGALERVGHSDEAIAIYRELLDADADDVEVLQRLAEIYRREGPPAALAEPIERLWRLAEARLGRDDDELDEPLAFEALGLELAGAHRDAGAPDRAEEVLRAIIDRGLASVEALEELADLLAARGAWEAADELYGRRLDFESDGPTRAALAVARARARLAVPGGEEAALAWFRRAPLVDVPADALLLHVDLALAHGAHDEALSLLAHLRARDAAAGALLRGELERRFVAIARKPDFDAGKAAARFEDLLASHPGDPAIVDAIFEASGRLDDVRARNRAWMALAERIPSLGATHRSRIHLALAGTAERDGDLAAAEEEYRRALALDTEGALRVEQLVGHARVLLALRDVEEATADLEEAIAIAPGNAAALALLGDLAYRAQDWERARWAYDQLAAAPGVQEVVSPAVVAFRRAELAEMFGDDAEAEASYRAVAALDASHVEAREALAQVASFKEDLAEAARWLEELLVLYPPEALDKVEAARLQLAGIRLRLGDDAAARHHLEVVASEAPERVQALEMLAAVYERLGLAQDAAQTLGRLARVYGDPRRKAEALYRQGEILRTNVGDREAANDAYLRSSDTDPTFVPTLVRLVAYYADGGDLAGVVEIGRELLAPGSPSDQVDPETRQLVAAAALAATPRDVPLARRALAGREPSGKTGSELLVALVGLMGRRAHEALLPALRALFEALPGLEPGPLRRALVALVSDEPWRLEPALALSKVAELEGALALARAASAIVAFLDPASPPGEIHRSLGPAPEPHAAALRPGALDHPDRVGPLRTVLEGLVLPLAGAPWTAPASEDTDAPAASADAVTLVAALRGRLQAPAVGVCGRKGQGEVAVVGARPPRIALGEWTERLSSAERTFLVARALEECRAGTFLVASLTDGGLHDLLSGVAEAAGAAPGAPGSPADGGGAADAGDGPPLGEIGRAAAALLAEPDRAAALPTGESRAVWLEALRAALARPPALGPYLHGCAATAERVGALLCRDPLLALSTVASAYRGVSAVRTDPMLVAVNATRAEQVRALPLLRELVAFLVSDEYEGALSDEAPASAEAPIGG